MAVADMAAPVFAAKYAAPRTVPGQALTVAGRWLRDEPRVVIASPPGYLHPADVVTALGEDVVWVWLDELDDDPTLLLSSIAHGVGRHVGGCALAAIAGTVVAPRHDAWSNEVASFATELEDVLAGRPLVLATTGRRVDNQALAMLADGLLPAMSTAARVVVVTGDSGDVRRVWRARLVDTDALRVRPDDIEAFAASVDPALPPALVHRVARLAEGRGATLSSVLIAGSVLGPDAFGRAVKRAGDLGDLLSTLLTLSLKGAGPDVIASLHVVSRLGFIHPRLIEAAVGRATMIGAPWLLELEDDWALADPLWRRALPVTLGPAVDLSCGALGDVARQLLDEGAPELAVPLCREAGDVAGLARCLDQIAQRPDAARRWEALEGGLYGAAPLPASTHPHLPRPEPEARGWRRLTRYLQRHNSVEARPASLAEPDDEAQDGHASPIEQSALVDEPMASQPTLTYVPERVEVCEHASIAAPAETGDRTGRDRRASCEARLLGTFGLSLEGTSVDEWAGTRGRSVLKYLLVHRDRPVRKETLMETFWPGAEPDASRNCLNVAVSSLRRSLRPLFGDVPVVLHHQGTYRFNPAIDVWVDIEQFEASSAHGLRLCRDGDLTAATVTLTDAVDLYRGAFLDDDPFEEWTIATRERLRVRFLDVLEQLSEIAFIQGRYDACIEVGQRTLREDCCREDTHRRMMRCHSRQGRAHLALRQYRSCVESLRVELAVEPSSDTVALYEEIRQHRFV